MVRMVRRGDQHGGNVFAASRQTGIGPYRWLDFSASVNPLGPSPRAVRGLRALDRALVHYPDPECVALRRALATAHRLAPERLLIGNGSSELIHLLPLALPIRRALILGPTFSEYERAVRLSGGRTIRLQATRAEAYRPPLREAAARLARGGRSGAPDAVILCNPNSPTGRAADPEDLAALVELARRRGAVTVLDETFVDFCEERSLLSQLDTHAGLVVLRSFTKFYGLAGLRVGYLAAREDLVARIRARQTPWSVNAYAQAAAAAALADLRHARATRLYVSRERDLLAAGLRKRGLTVYPSTANFLMGELPDGCSAPALADALRARGMLIRDLSRVPGLSARMIRVAVRLRRDNRRLVAALSTLLEHRRS